MTLAIVTHPACLEHFMGRDHPERPARLKTVLRLIGEPPFDSLPRFVAPRATGIQLRRAHGEDYVQKLVDLSPPEGLVALDPDTYMGPASLEAGLRAAGAVCLAVDQIKAGAAGRVFCAVRPPGHHAERSRAMGFCLFNNVAVGTLHALEAHHLNRVAIVDFDVHHGNGTQAIFQADPRVLYLSSHQSPLFPGTGEPDSGNEHVVDAALPPGSGSDEFRSAWADELLPALEDFQPEMIFVSAGFDGHRDDPLAQLELEHEDFAWITRRLREAADRSAQGRLVSTLEGGYDLDALRECVAAHLIVLMD